MLNLNKNIKRSQGGFTMIEVMIVLAIAAIVLVGVLVAAQALQRSGRNQGRQADVGAIHAFLIDYKAKKGEFPDATDKGAAWQSDTIGGIKLDSLQHYKLDSSHQVWITNGKEGPKWDATNKKLVMGAAAGDLGNITGAQFSQAVDNLIIITGHECTLANITGTAAVSTLIGSGPEAKNAIIYALEGDDLVYCRAG